MPLRTDMKLDASGQIVAANSNTADAAKPLPKVEASDLLQSDKYGQVWQAEAGGNDGALDALGAAQASISQAFLTFTQIRENKSPSIAQSVHLNNLARDFDRTLKTLAERVDRAKDTAQKRLASIDTEFRDSVRWNTQDAAELRAVIRSMDAEQRSKLISDAIQSGDGQILAAVIGGHHALTGITEAQRGAYRAQAMQQHRPDLLALERTLHKAQDVTRGALHDLLERGDAITASAIRKQYAAEAEAATAARDRLKQYA